MTLKTLRKIIKDLPDDMSLVEKDHCEDHLHVDDDQLRVEQGALVFTPSRVQMDLESQ